MTLFRNIVFAAALAGLIAGLFATIGHAIGTVPIILKAETYEKAGETAAPAASADTATAEHHHDAAAWEPAEGFERTAFTVLADVLTGIAFGLLLTAAYALRGRAMDWRQGLFWGLAGFATFTLAPGLGLPPEVPGTESAPLFDRQIWWVATAIATAGGLALIFFTRQIAATLFGAALIALPHLYGAPQPAEYKSLVPEGLAHSFVVAVVVTSFLFWLVLGSLTGALYRWLAGAPQVLLPDHGGLDQHA
ncbi:MAG TPA: CbtA family protein [Candidatus Acidoferrum sp.]|nr:CbtA family protein [Candidatus Acidoferrum sp.]